ncbi:MAG: hypothetical protein ACE5J6_02150 [Candidatus Bathyarchaeia archaeon]
MTKRTKLRIAKATTSKIAQKAYGPAPNPIGGSGSIHITTPALLGDPKKIVAIIMMIIPKNVRVKPRRNSLNGVGHGKGSNTGASRLSLS